MNPRWKMDRRSVGDSDLTEEVSVNVADTALFGGIV